MTASARTFRLASVEGATPDKWIRAWRDQDRGHITLIPVNEADQEAHLRNGTVDMALVRFPIDTTGMHAVRLYDEVQVAVAPRGHFIEAADELTLEDLREEQLVLPHRSGWRPEVEQLPWPAMSARDAVATVAAGTGIALLPMSIARLHARKDVVSRPVADLEPTTVALAWLIERDDETCQAFVGVVKGRRARSSRG